MPPSLSLEPAISGHILVVDDEPSILAIASAILNTIAVTPLKARNGEDALATVQAHYASGHKVSLVIQDLTMPGGMSGFETMEALRDIDPEIRVIACSGFFQDGALELCQSIGFSNILAKPYTPDSLLGLIRRTLLEAPPPRIPKSPRNAEPPTGSPACFTPAASSTPVQPVASFGFSSPNDDQEEDDDEPVFHSPEPSLNFAPGSSNSEAPPSQYAYSSTPSPTLVADLPEQAVATETPLPRRTSFLASALAQSVRSRLQPQRDEADDSSSQLTE